MSIRSEVGVALKSSIVERMTTEQISRWFGDADDHMLSDEGQLWAWHRIKWYRGDAAIAELYEFLESVEHDDYLVVVATPEYPDSEEGCVGGWDENSWNLHRYVSCGVTYS